MAPVIPSGVPASVVAGDTMMFTVSVPSHPVSEGWMLSISFVGNGALHTEPSEVTTDGVTWTVTVPATRTRILSAKPGAFRWFQYMTGSGLYAGQRATVAEGVIDVRPNPADAIAGDFRAQCEKDLEVVEAAMSGRLASDMQAYTIRGRQVVHIPYQELVTERNRLRREVWRLRNPGKMWPSVKVVMNGLY